MSTILTVDRYVIPINIVSGLPYISMQPYTDVEWDDLPHVVLTLDLDCDPSVLDHTIEDGEQWYDALCDLEENPYESPFDSEGNYLRRIVMQTISWTSSGDKAPTFLNAFDTTLPNDIDAIFDHCVYQAQDDPCIYQAHTAQTDILTMAPHTVNHYANGLQDPLSLVLWMATCRGHHQGDLQTMQYAWMPMSTYSKCVNSSLCTWPH
jgi:hypothetical protein